MISWLTTVGARLENSTIFANESDRFKQGVTELKNLSDRSTGTLSADVISNAIIGKPAEERQAMFERIATTCLMLTGQSNNSLKCQFPVFLLQGSHKSAKHLLKLSDPSKENPSLAVIDMERVGRAIKEGENDSDSLRELVGAYFECVFSRSNMERLQGVVAALDRASATDEGNLIEAMAVSAIRGSATASGGHDPEEQLRLQMEEWGLRRNTDFNSSDVTAAQLKSLCGCQRTSEDKSAAKKSRAFDFVIPYIVENRKPRLLVQGQFYAGDSGSVSHKNVDQTSTGRSAATQVVDDPVFAEFLDGAGYVTALAGDAKKLLEMNSTSGLIQLRTAAIRLRELLQRICFATPLEVAHAVWASQPADKNTVLESLTNAYDQAEATRAFEQAIEQGWISYSDNHLVVPSEHHVISLEYAILDSIAIATTTEDCPKSEACRGGLVIPGYDMSDRCISKEFVLKQLKKLLPGLPPALSDSQIGNAVERLICKGRLGVKA